MFNEERKTEKVRDLETKINRLKEDLEFYNDLKAFSVQNFERRINDLQQLTAVTGTDSSLAKVKFEETHEKNIKRLDSKIETIKQKIEETVRDLEIAKENQKDIFEYKSVVEHVAKLDIRKITDAF